VKSSNFMDRISNPAVKKTSKPSNKKKILFAADQLQRKRKFTSCQRHHT
jgi:hypothetical protein